MALNLNVKTALYKGVFGVSETPQQWPTKYYEKQVGQKPTVCPLCGFVATNPRQIELHHPVDIESGPKKKRNPVYYRTTDLKPLCANCHSLQHRSGEHLIEKCGEWRRELPKSRKYIDPDLIFSNNCAETYRLQKSYFMKWHLTSADQYKCQRCGVSHWPLVSSQKEESGGTKVEVKKPLSLELHHKDGSHKNSLISNLELLCPNCHRNA